MSGLLERLRVALSKWPLNGSFSNGSLANYIDGIVIALRDAGVDIAAIEAASEREAKLRECLHSFVNGVSTGMITSDADEALAIATQRARQALGREG